jgi:phosphoribosylanthranilate isomerase
MIKVKVCGLTDPLNVKSVTGTGIDFVGYIFYPRSKRFLGWNPDKSLFSVVPEGVQKTGVFVDADPVQISEIAEYASLDIVQLHGNESIEYCRSLKDGGFHIIKTFGVGRDFDPASTDSYSDVCDYFLFDTKSEDHGGTGIKFNWSILENYPFLKPFFLSGGLGPEDANLTSLIRSDKFFAIDLNSRFEISSGIKDIASLRIFIDKLKMRHI